MVFAAMIQQETNELQNTLLTRVCYVWGGMWKLFIFLSGWCIVVLFSVCHLRHTPWIKRPKYWLWHQNSDTKFMFTKHFINTDSKLDTTVTYVGLFTKLWQVPGKPHDLKMAPFKTPTHRCQCSHSSYWLS